jgi:nucleoside-diphosphate-sugar epimerase
MESNLLIGFDDPILITGSSGFIGSKVVEALLSYGFKNLRCFVRSARNLSSLESALASSPGAKIELIKGNLLSREDCRRATAGTTIVYHLAAGIEKTFPGCFMNSVVTTRNLLDSALKEGSIKRFVNVSSFAVYSNFEMKRGELLDETCDVESHLMERYEPYVFGKLRQDELVLEYAKKYGIGYAIVRPGPVFGPGKNFIPSRVGIDTFGFFLHLGGSIQIPLTYVDNCAEAIVLAGLKKGFDGEVFNIVDDDLPTSRMFLKMYKRNVNGFRSLYIPYRMFYLFCYLWEKYSVWSFGQLPLAFNRRKCAAYWKGNRYSNRKSKELLGWKPKVIMGEALRRYFDFMREDGKPNA